MQRTRRILARVLVGALVVGAGLVLPAAAWAEGSVHASNSCEDCEAESGDATSSNGNSSFTGQSATGPGASNFQEGDNSSELGQDSEASSGDAASGQVIGSGGGDADIVASSEGEGLSALSGDATSANTDGSFTGLSAVGPGASNTQFGDNESETMQSSSAISGDAMTGQVIGVG